MNERIQKLYQQATIRYSVYETLKPRDERKSIPDIFAELIVKECRTVINDVYHKTPLELCGPLLTVDEEIMKHFYGVEE